MSVVIVGQKASLKGNANGLRGRCGKPGDYTVTVGLAIPGEQRLSALLLL